VDVTPRSIEQRASLEHRRRILNSLGSGSLLDLPVVQAGATPKELQVVLGHASAAFSLTQNGHVFDADLDRVADRLDALRDAQTGQGRDTATRGVVLFSPSSAESGV
jgi:hypothetical protein